MVTNRFQAALTRIRSETRAEVLMAWVGIEELLDFFNSGDGSRWLSETRLKGVLLGDDWSGEKFLRGWTDGYIINFSKVHMMFPRLPRGVSLRIFLRGKKGEVKEIFFGKKVEIYFPEVVLDPPRELTYADKCDPGCQNLARLSALQSVQEIATPEEIAGYEVFIYDVQASPRYPFACMVVERLTPEKMVKELGARWVNRMCNIFEEALWLPA